MHRLMGNWLGLLLVSRVRPHRPKTWFFRWAQGDKNGNVCVRSTQGTLTGWIHGEIFSIFVGDCWGPDCWRCLWFFRLGRLLREVNMTIISLELKKANPTTLSDFRPISCCNTIYKCITRILGSGIRELLPSLIGSEQSAFIPGRWIVDNMLLAHELFMGYHAV